MADFRLEEENHGGLGLVAWSTWTPLDINLDQVTLKPHHRTWTPWLEKIGGLGHQRTLTWIRLCLQHGS